MTVTRPENRPDSGSGVTQLAQPAADTPRGEFVSRAGVSYYAITDYDRMDAFLMALVSDSDLWMYISSNGGLTGGRVDPDGSLFPYETVDRLHDCHHTIGPVTCIRVRDTSGSNRLWEPFTRSSRDLFAIQRTVYKNSLGSRIAFEERNDTLGLVFNYEWSANDRFGFVRSARIENLLDRPREIDLLDGLRNILPSGVPADLQMRFSCLVDAYKRNEIDSDINLGMFSLTAEITDRATAAEALTSSVVWSNGLDDCRVALSLEQVAAFRRGEIPRAECANNGKRGNYLIAATLDVPSVGSKQWQIVADTGLDHVRLSRLRALIIRDPDVSERLAEAQCECECRLREYVASADGLQATADQMAVAHHAANVLFNNMRGGVFFRNYDFPARDLREFIRRRNHDVWVAHDEFLTALPESESWIRLVAAAARREDPSLERLCYEYLPLTFGRRHGDPSRPWNRFSIRVRDNEGNDLLSYEGNWRDIFQNWEALGISHPGFLAGMIAKFLNASTIDGFNPYRVSRDGVEWEEPNPDESWSTIGYWGDHQIVYLLRLLEACQRFYPGLLRSWLGHAIFSYADVPYRIKPYAKIVQAPRETVEFDDDAAKRIEARVLERGSDGRLLTDADGRVCHANLIEKLLVQILSKVSNLVVDGGIWMNTQRPEWNDANNALAGHGLSVVTLCYLRRHLDFCRRILADVDIHRFTVATEVVEWFDRIHAILEKSRSLLRSEVVDDSNRRDLLDSLGSAFSDYRGRVYGSGFSGKSEVEIREVRKFLEVAGEYLEHAARTNRRPDSLYHSYNVLDINRDRRAGVDHLQEMLEGQVAILSSGMVEPAEILAIVDRLFEGDLYREDQRSFLLYPERPLPGFLDKNLVPSDRVEGNPLLSALLKAGDTTVLARDAAGVLRFDCRLVGVAELAAALDRISRHEAWGELVAQHRDSVFEIFEEVFRHRQFTGRSGTMYAYEGLGSIYWHMVSKLLLAVQECFFHAIDDNQPESVIRALGDAYYRIRAGLSSDKTPLEYGAFPMDPYSHTPRHSGAQQPGMTGQVKEEILTRYGELGVRVNDGRVSFRPALLRRREFLTSPRQFSFVDLARHSRSLDLEPGSLAFTFCQTPVVYSLRSSGAPIRCVLRGDPDRAVDGDMLDRETSAGLFERRGTIGCIEVDVPATLIARD